MESKLETYFSLYIRLAEIMRSNVTLCGNILLNVNYPDGARLTQDLDLSIPSEKENTELLRELKKFGDYCVATNSYGVVKYDELRCATLEHNGGMKLRANDNSVRLSIDIALEKDYGCRQYRYNVKGIDFYGNSIEAVLCDKCISTLSPQRFRRAKDFFDLQLILDNEIKYDEEKVFILMENKIGRKLLYEYLNNYPFTEETLIKCQDTWSKLTLSSFNKEAKIEKLSWLESYSKVSTIYSRLNNISILRGYRTSITKEF